MALHIINEPSFGGRLGEAFGTGIGGLLQNLVQSKAKQIQQNQRALGYEKGFGLEPEQAKLLAQQPDDFQQIALKSLIEAQQANAFQQALNPQMGTEQSYQAQPSLESTLQHALSGAQPQNAIEMNLQRGLPKLVQQEQQLGKAALLPERPEQRIGAAVAQQPQKASQGKTLQDAFRNRPLNPNLAAKAAQFEQKERHFQQKLSREEQKEINAETLPTYHKVNEMARGARESDMRLDRIETLLNKGNVQDNVFLRALDSLSHNKYLGEFASVFKTLISNRDTQEFEKLSKDFLRDAKQFFGNRVTQGEVFTFLQTVPSISQTNEGKRRVIRNMRIFNDAAKLRKNAMDSLIKENHGKRPENLESLIDERIGSQLDALSEEFKSGATLGKGFNLRQF